MAAQQTIGLPEDVYVALTDALRAVARDPFDPAFSRPTADVHVRHVVFASSGMAFVFVNPEAKLVTIYRVAWAG